METARNGETQALIGQEDRSVEYASNGLSKEASSSQPTMRKWLPGLHDEETIHTGRHSVCRVKHSRSIKRRIFLVLTEPETSVASTAFFAILVVTITMMNFVMILQTMEVCQFTPTDCQSCGGQINYPFDNDDAVETPPDGILCQCPPEPYQWSTRVLETLVYFFSIEWVLRVLLFEPAFNERSNFYLQWFQFVTSPSVILDALAVFPYYFETLSNSNGLMSLRLLRLFRVFQVVRLGQYSDSFKSLTTVLIKSLPYLKLLIVVLMFGATFFGSMLYWVEKGQWKFFEPTQTFEFIRLDQHGKEEISPFSSISSAFWWFLVTATTVGYGDTFPTSMVGKWIACMAMMMGVLVIAFPVSVFSELWSKELRQQGALDVVDEEDEAVEPATNQSQFENAEVHVTLLEVGHGRQASLDSLFQDPRRAVTLEMDDEHLVMRKDDLNSLLTHMADINESQRQIKGILRRYKLH